MEVGGHPPNYRYYSGDHPLDFDPVCIHDLRN